MKTIPHIRFSFYTAMLLCILTLLNFTANSQQTSVSFSGDSSSSFANGKAIAIDKKGNMYITGHFFNELLLGTGNNQQQLNSTGDLDVFVCKYDKDGTLSWARQLGGSLEEKGNSIALDNDNNIYITGVFSGTADFNPGDATFEMTSKGSFDLFVCKLDQEGNLVWAKQLGGPSYDFATDIAVDHNGNAFVCGYTDGQQTGDLQVSDVKNSTGNDAGFICKLNRYGTIEWTKSLQGSSYTACYAITSDNEGALYTTGKFNGTSDFDPGKTSFNLSSTSADEADMFLSKLNSEGEFLWAIKAGGRGEDKGMDLACDGNGNIVVTGSFESTIDFDPGKELSNLSSNGGSDIFICKLNSVGKLIWVKQAGGALNDHGHSILIDRSNKILVAGSFASTVHIGSGISLQSAGGSDIFICSLDETGNSRWAQREGNKGEDKGNGIALDQAGQAIVIGTTQYYSLEEGNRRPFNSLFFKRLNVNSSLNDTGLKTNTTRDSRVPNTSMDTEKCKGRGTK